MSQNLNIAIPIGEKQVVVLVGNSGSGKSTLTKSLCQLGIGFGYLGTGKLLAQEQLRNPSLGKILASFTARGEQVPNDYILPLVRQWFAPLVSHRLIIADGYPRNLSQVDDALLLFHGNGFLRVATIYLDTPPEKCAHQLALQAGEAKENNEERHDHTEEAIAQRLSAFPEKVKPILQVLEEKCARFVRVDTTAVCIKDPIVVRKIALDAGLVYEP